MNKLAVALIGILVTTTLQAQQPTNGLGNLFQGKPSLKPVSSQENKTFGLPSLSMPKLSMPKLPKFKGWQSFKNTSPAVKPAASDPPRPSWFHQIGEGTKTFFSKSSAALKPWGRPVPKAMQPKIVPAFMQPRKQIQDKVSSGTRFNLFSPKATGNPVKATISSDGGVLPPVKPVIEK
ncbi:MAG: hypothetical protein VX438_02005 [Planctomycetota bacterium]|nr:hypothetical protein [Planctomycetota bacterium]